jgi:hypothetical protein
MIFKWQAQIGTMWRLAFGARLLASLAALTLVFSAAAQSVQWPVTPSQLEYSNFVFSVTTRPTNGETAFHVTIATKTEAIQPDSAALLAVITGTAKLPVVTGLNPSVPVTLKRTDRLWLADFTAPGDVLNNPAVYFVFVVDDYTTNPDGTRTYLTSDRMYEIRLLDFLPNP